MQTQTSGPIASRATSETIIPAVRGEFYSYSATFTPARPLYCLMKCKANKDRELMQAEELGSELDLVFDFSNGGVRACSPCSMPGLRLLGNLVAEDALNRTFIARTDMTADEFYRTREQQRGPSLGAFCHSAIALDTGAVTLTPNTVVAVVTASGKYGLFLVKEQAPERVAIDACHILL